METTGAFRGLRIVGGNLALDLLNTRTGPNVGDPDGDVLERYEDLVAWAEHLGVITGDGATRLLRRAQRRPAAASAAFARAIAIREALDHVFRAVAHGERARDSDLARLASDEVEGLSRARLIADGDGYRWSWDRDSGLEGPLWPAVHAAMELVTHGPLTRVKGCDSCRFLFVDESRNRSRRWCSMDDCGTQDKMRTFVARRRAIRATRSSRNAAVSARRRQPSASR